MHIEFYRKSWKGFNLLSNKRMTLFLLFLIPWIGNAQVQTYHGRVFDSKGRPLEFANVIALSLPDSVVTKGTVTNDTGEFTLHWRISLINPYLKLVLLATKPHFQPKTK